MERRLKATVAVTKFEAVRRQLNAAILMYFREDDELAVHSVGHAAYSLTREILRKRGANDAHEELLKAGLLEMLRADHRTLDVLDLDRVDNNVLLAYAVSAYGELGLPLSTEMLTFMTYLFSTQTLDYLSPSHVLRERVDALRAYDVETRKFACRYIIGDDIRSIMTGDDEM